MTISNIIVNPCLVWDYDLKESDFEREEVRSWYIARVLAKGNWKDIQDVGLDNIKKYLPSLTIPEETREFWEWYFSEGEQYVSDNRTTEKTDYNSV
jgi:hypothetical protein